MKGFLLLAALVAAASAASVGYTAPEPTNMEPEPTYKEPEPTEYKPEPTYQEPEPEHKAPEPTEYKPEPTNAEPKPTEYKETHFVEEKEEKESSHGASDGYKSSFTYQGMFEDKCGDDGLYFRDESSFVFCSNGNSYVQPCAPGTKNSGYAKFTAGDEVAYRDFCDVNMVDGEYMQKTYNTAPRQYEPPTHQKPPHHGPFHLRPEPFVPFVMGPYGGHFYDYAYHY
jgi:hypothetical protein